MKTSKQLTTDNCNFPAKDFLKTKRHIVALKIYRSGHCTNGLSLMSIAVSHLRRTRDTVGCESSNINEDHKRDYSFEGSS